MNVNIPVPLWLFIGLIVTNAVVWIVIALFIYFVFAILDLTYFERHKSKQKKEEKGCPEKIELNTPCDIVSEKRGSDDGMSV